MWAFESYSYPTSHWQWDYEIWAAAVGKPEDKPKTTECHYITPQCVISSLTFGVGYV